MKSTKITLLDGSEWTFSELAFTRSNEALKQSLFNGNTAAFFALAEKSLAPNHSEDDINAVLDSGNFPSPFRADQKPQFQAIMAAFKGE